MKKAISLFLIGLAMFAVGANTAQAQTVSNTRMVVAPYFQADGNGGVYTFIGVTHPSLSAANSNIGMTVSAVGATGSDGSSNPSTTFTISAGQTYRIIVAATNSSVASSVSGASYTQTILTTSGTDVYGMIQATPSCTADPALANNCGSLVQSGKYANLSQLNFWGAVVVLSTASGFAMEFIGDLHDSNWTVGTAAASAGNTSGGARGVSGQ